MRIKQYQHNKIVISDCVDYLTIPLSEISGKNKNILIEMISKYFGPIPDIINQKIFFLTRSQYISEDTSLNEACLMAFFLMEYVQHKVMDHNVTMAVLYDKDENVLNFVIGNITIFPKVDKKGKNIHGKRDKSLDMFTIEELNAIYDETIAAAEKAQSEANTHLRVAAGITEHIKNTVAKTAAV